MIRQIWEQHRAHVADLSSHRPLKALLISAVFAGSLPSFLVLTPIVFFPVGPIEELESVEGVVDRFPRPRWGMTRGRSTRRRNRRGLPMVVRTDQRSEYVFRVPIYKEREQEIHKLLSQRVTVHWNSRFEKPLLWLNSFSKKRVLQLESSRKVHIAYSYEQEKNRRRRLRMIFFPFWVGSLATMIYLTGFYRAQASKAASEAKQYLRFRGNSKKGK